MKSKISRPISILLHYSIEFKIFHNQLSRIQDVVIGTNNYLGATNAGDGLVWADLVDNVNTWITNQGFGSQETADGGSDIEVEWNTASNTESWVNAYNQAASNLLYDYGDDSGGTNPNQNGWTAQSVWAVSYGDTWDEPVPQIYYTGDATSDWQPLSLWAYNNEGYSIYFPGTLTEYATNSSTLTPSQGWSALFNALNSNSNTSQTTIPYSTDITKVN